MRWITSLPQSPHILALQEVKADQFRLGTSLWTIVPDHQQLYAEPTEGRGGAALLIHPSFNITDSGTFDDGRAVWALLDSAQGKFGVVSIYGPSSPRERAVLWNDIKLIYHRGIG